MPVENTDHEDTRAPETDHLADDKVRQAVEVETEGLRRKRDELLDANRKLKDRLAELGDMTANDLADLRQSASRLADVQADGERYRAALFDHLTESAALRAIVAEKGVPELLLPHVKSRLTVCETDGRFDIVAEAAYGPAAADEPASVADIVRAMKADAAFGRAFDASGMSGSGARRSADSGIRPNPFSKETFNLTEQGRLMRESPALYDALKHSA